VSHMPKVSGSKGLWDPIPRAVRRRMQADARRVRKLRQGLELPVRSIIARVG
jgi:hypothetical protein